MDNSCKLHRRKKIYSDEKPLDNKKSRGFVILNKKNTIKKHKRV